MSDLNQFDPVQFSIDENKFLLEHLGEAPSVALRGITSVPLTEPNRRDKNPTRWPSVNPAAVRPILERVQELLQLEAVGEIKWKGIEVIKNAIRVWLRESAKWEQAHARNAKIPRWPSLYSFDAKGRPHIGGPGSDAGQVRTYFGPAGERLPFAVDLLEDTLPDFVAPTLTEASSSPELVVNAEASRIECRVKVADGVCGHTESYKAGSRASYNAARARMSKHLRRATDESFAHRELHTLEFGE